MMRSTKMIVSDMLLVSMGYEIARSRRNKLHTELLIPNQSDKKRNTRSKCNKGEESTIYSMEIQPHKGWHELRFDPVY